jgi:exonuclease SbcD
MGHLYVAGADVEYLSERRVSIGGQESAPLRLFPPDLDYVALGHIHRAQRVGRDSIRYAGAPIALALPEARNRQQVIAIDFFSDGHLAEIRSLPVPRAVEIVRVPVRGAAPLGEVLGALDALPPLDAQKLADRPFLEVVVALAKPEPNLRALVETALADKHPRLVHLHVEHTGDRAALGDRVATTHRLAELDPRDVFQRLWARDHAMPPEPAVLAAFERLLDEVRGDREDPEDGVS